MGYSKGKMENENMCVMCVYVWCVGVYEVREEGDRKILQSYRGLHVRYGFKYKASDRYACTRLKDMTRRNFTEWCI